MSDLGSPYCRNVGIFLAPCIWVYYGHSEEHGGLVILLDTLGYPLLWWTSKRQLREEYL